jgi:hypothetical protein
MAALLPSPELQFLDENGHPYSGGSLTTFAPGTTTGKITWRDPDATVANQNPITLDTAGRCICYGDGNYRLILDDAAGNLIFDQPSTTLVSVAMAPVVIAPTLADARRLLGVDDAIADEAAARAAADAAEQNARIAADAALGVRIDDETAARIAADNALGARIDAIPPPSSDVLPPGYSMRFGNATSDGRGNFTGTFSPPFPSTCDSIVTTASMNFWAGINYTSAAGFAGVTSSPLSGGDWHSGPIAVNWIAVGH